MGILEGGEARSERSLEKERQRDTQLRVSSPSTREHLNECSLYFGHPETIQEMARQTPADLVDEILTRGGRWSLSSARLRPLGAREAGDLNGSVAFCGGDCWSDVPLDSRPLREARLAAEALKRSGYEILSIRSKPFYARRPLRGLRELSAEVRRLELLCRDRTTVGAFPLRVPRQPGLPTGSGPFWTTGFNRLRHVHTWKLDWVSASRKGPATFVEAPTWWTGAWCLFLDDGDDRWVDFHVQLFKRGSRRPTTMDGDFARLTSAARSRLGPLGYRALRLRGRKNPHFAVFEKRVDTLSIARRERAHLDRVLFGD